MRKSCKKNKSYLNQDGGMMLYKYAKNTMKSLLRKKKDNEIKRRSNVALAKKLLKFNNQKNTKKTNKKLRRKTRRLIKFQREKMIKMRLTDWYKEKNTKKIENYLRLVFGNIKDARKYLYLYLKYDIPITINTIKYNDYGSNITLYKYKSSQWLKNIKNKYEDEDVEIVLDKIETMLEYYKKFENNDKYLNFVNKIDRIFDKSKDLNDEDSIKNCFYSLLSFETMETLKSKNLMKFFIFIYRIKNILDFTKKQKTEKINKESFLVYENLNYYNKETIYKRLVFPFFLSLCDLSYHDNNDIIRIIELLNYILSKDTNNSNQITDFTINCPGNYLLDCYPKTLYFHYCYNNETNVFIVCRGTSNVSELNQDRQVHRIDTEFGYIHQGFYNTYNSRIKLELVNYLKKIKDKCLNKINFYITGHSLGGALGVLIGCDIKNIYSGIFTEPKYKLGLVSLYTFSCPQVGTFNDKYKENRSVDINFSIYNNVDIVYCMQDLHNVIKLPDITKNYYVNQFLAYQTGLILPTDKKETATQYPVNSKIINYMKIDESCESKLCTPTKENIEKIIKEHKYTNQFSYNINTAIYNELSSSLENLKDKVDVFHGNFRFEENGEYYALMGTPYWYFDIVSNELVEKTTPYKRKIPNKNSNLSFIETDFKYNIKSTYK